MKKLIALTLALAICFTFFSGFSLFPDRKVEKAIDSIGTVTLDSLPAIEEAERMYSELSAKNKAKVDNYSKLVAARSAYRKLEEAQIGQRVLDALDAASDKVYESGSPQAFDSRVMQSLEPSEVEYRMEEIARHNDNVRLSEDGSQILYTSRQDYFMTWENHALAEDLGHALTELRKQDTSPTLLEPRIKDLDRVMRGILYCWNREATQLFRDGKLEEANAMILDFVGLFPNIAAQAEGPYTIDFDQLIALQLNRGSVKSLDTYEPVKIITALDIFRVSLPYDVYGTKTLDTPEAVAEMLRELLAATCDYSTVLEEARIASDAFGKPQILEELILELKDRVTYYNEGNPFYPSNNHLLGGDLVGDYNFAVTAGDFDLVVKIENRIKPSEYTLRYVYAGETATFNLPDGTFAVKFATGSVWDHESSFFGEHTRFFRITDCEPKFIPSGGDGSLQVYKYNFDSINLATEQKWIKQCREITRDEF